MNVIIPIGGMGKRFSDEGYLVPKPLINILGEPMICNVIDNLKLEIDDKLIIIYNSELENYNFSSIIKKKYNSVILIELLFQTDGAIETILYGLNNILKTNSELLDNQCVLLDCDVIYNVDLLNKIRNSNNKNLVVCFNDDNLNPIYSYVKVDDLNNIIEIKEKNKISNYANSGCYCFENGNILKNNCEYIISNNIRQKNEYYISGLIEIMLPINIFNIIIINNDDFDCVGTPSQLKLYSIKHKIKEPKRFCFDLDNTLVSFPQITNDYTTCKPIYKNINFLKKLKNNGHYIIIYTARKMKTFDGNIGKLTQHIGKITFDTLEKYNIPYDEIIFGKPYADFYIDDLAINCFQNLEYFTGIYENNICERSFNNIKFFDTHVIKTSKTNVLKIFAEIYFYENIPSEINYMFPKFINKIENGYIIEKINGLNLSHLFTNNLMNETLFINLLNDLKKIHEFESVDIKNIDIYLNYCNKLKYRYESFNYDMFDGSKKIYETLMNELTIYINNNKGKKGVIHGDPVFSNILINDKNAFIFIDMKGTNHQEFTIYGDIFYDYAKIYQSLIGYDEIILNKNILNKYRTDLIRVFNKFIETNYGYEYIGYIKMITKSLIFTLVPLHDIEIIHDLFSLIHKII